MADEPFNFGHVHAALRVERMQGVRVGLHELVEDRHDVAVGVLDNVEAEIPVPFGELGEIGRDKFTKLGRAEKGGRY